MCWCAASAVWRPIPPAPAASSTGAQSTVPEPVAGRAALGCPAGPDYTWTGSTRSLLPELRPGQSAEVPLEVRKCIKIACLKLGTARWQFAGCLVRHGTLGQPRTLEILMDGQRAYSSAQAAARTVCGFSHTYARTPQCAHGNCAWQETLDLSMGEHLRMYVYTGLASEAYNNF